MRYISDNPNSTVHAALPNKIYLERLDSLQTQEAYNLFDFFTQVFHALDCDSSTNRAMYSSRKEMWDKIVSPDFNPDIPIQPSDLLKG